VVPEYGPDLLDDICHTTIEPGSFDGIYCDAVLQHVTEYWTAIRNMREILVDGGEAFIYVPFFWELADRVDYHRFTITEVARMLEDFSEVKIFVPGKASGWGYVVWSVVSYARLTRLPEIHRAATTVTNALLAGAVSVWWRLRPRDFTREQAVFYYTYIYCNHGFCAWVRK
jgi:hypothetical protein